MFARLLILFVAVPVVELVLFMLIGARIGLVPTFAIILFTGILGAWLTKLQGLRTLARYQQAVGEGRLPHHEVMDGLLILVAGAVLLTPGFLTDAVGFLLLVPAIRSAVRNRLAQYLKGKIQVVGAGMDRVGGQAQNDGVFPEAGSHRSPDDVIIEAEVVEETERRE